MAVTRGDGPQANASNPDLAARNGLPGLAVPEGRLSRRRAGHPEQDPDLVSASREHDAVDALAELRECFAVVAQEGLQPAERLDALPFVPGQVIVSDMAVAPPGGGFQKGKAAGAADGDSDYSGGSSPPPPPRRFFTLSAFHLRPGWSRMSACIAGSSVRISGAMSPAPLSRSRNSSSRA